MSAAPITAAAAATAIRTVLKVNVVSSLRNAKAVCCSRLGASRSNQRGRPGATHEPLSLCGV